SVRIVQDFLGSHVYVSRLITFIDAMRFRSSEGSLDDAEDVVLAQDEVLLALDLDLGAAVLAEQHAVALLDLELADAAVLEDLAVAHGDDLALDGLLLRGVGDDDPTLGL